MQLLLRPQWLGPLGFTSWDASSSLQAAFDAGAKARCLGHTADACPFDRAALRAEWIDGHRHCDRQRCGAASALCGS